MTPLGYFVGIDLGTTFSAAAIHRAGRTSICLLGNRSASIPSLVFLREDQAVLTGEAAERRGMAEPTRLAREFKRRIGDTAPIMLGQAPYSAERLMAVQLKQVVAAVATREGAEPDGVAVCHPANWGPFKIDLLRHALDLAGLRTVTLLTEPIAAAMHYASKERVEAGSVIAVYDLGGGTFDAAVLRKTDTGFATLGEPEGIERLGGIDFDEAVLAYVRTALGGKLEELDGRDPATRVALGRLRRECVAAKEALSFDSDTAIPVMLPNVQTDLRINRAEFEPMIRAAIGETIEALRRAIERAGVRPEDLASVLLVGGSSQIPLVAEMVSSALGRPVAVDAHPKNAIALGAALAAVAAGPADAGPAVAPAPVPEAPVPAAPESERPAPIPVPQPVTVPPPPRSGSGANGPQRLDGPGRRPPRRAAVAAVGAVLVGAATFGAYILGSNAKDEDSASAETPDETTPSTSTTPSSTEPPLPGCASESGRCAFITGLKVEGDKFVADFETTGYEPLIFEEGVKGTPDDHHVHFFFDTTAPANAGTNGQPKGQWVAWDQAVYEVEVALAGDAEQLCAAVGTALHEVELDSGNCVPLPQAEA